MIGKNWMKAVTVAGVGLAMALPVMSEASTHYTGKTPASIAMMGVDTGSSVSTVSTVRKHKAKHHGSRHSSVKKASSKTRRNLRKKHTSTTVKKLSV